jgi:hypothetical protein
VELAALDHRVVEHRPDPRRQRLGAVEDAQDRAGRVQAPVPEVSEQITHDGGVLGVALGQTEGVLGPVDADPQRHDAEMIGEVDAVDHQRHQVELGQVGGE